MTHEPFLCKEFLSKDVLKEDASLIEKWVGEARDKEPQVYNFSGTCEQLSWTMQMEDTKPRS